MVVFCGGMVANTKVSGAKVKNMGRVSSAFQMVGATLASTMQTNEAAQAPSSGPMVVPTRGSFSGESSMAAASSNVWMAGRWLASGTSGGCGGVRLSPMTSPGLELLGQSMLSEK